MLLTSALLSLLGASTTQIPFNLHVLSLPPAFVLSQDQTLKLNLILPVITFYSKEFSLGSSNIQTLYYKIYRPHIL